MKSSDDGKVFQPPNPHGGKKISGRNTEHLKNSFVVDQTKPSKTSGTQIQISKPGDSSEREADRMAKQAMQSHVGERLSNVGIASASGAAGRPLSSNERIFFEKGFQEDFQQVRIHDDENANVLARQLNARAFTYGPDIYFAAGELTTNDEGKKLLAHELGHVVQQQRSGKPLIQRQEQPSGSFSGPPARSQFGPLTSPSLAEFIGSRTVDGFAFGSSTLDSAQEDTLRDYARTVSSLLREHPGSYIELIGHTDAPGEAADNIALGQARANTVRMFLIGEGLDPARLNASSAGETRQRIQTRGRDRRNRRVEIRFHSALPFGLGQPLAPRSPVPSPDATAPPRAPMPWEIPPNILLPPGPLRPERPRGPNIFTLPPVTRPPSRDFLRKLSRWLTGSLGRREIARLAARMAAELGMDEEEIRRELDDALVSAGEAGLKEILKRIIHGLAGAPSSRLPEGAGPEPPRGVPGERIFRLPPIPF